jgi:hypothetical protein
LLSRARLRIDARELGGNFPGLAGRFVLTAVVIAALATFAAALPAYRDSFTAAVRSASFDLEIFGCGCSPRDVERIPGVERAAGVLGLLDIRMSDPEGRTVVSSFGWALDATTDGAMTPVGPARIVEGAFDLGSPEAPGIVLDRELAGEIGASVGSNLALHVRDGIVKTTVLGIAGSAARFRGPSFAVLRAAVLPLLPRDPEGPGKYTEMLAQGTASVDEVAAQLGGSKVLIYTKAEQIESLESQLEVASPVIELVAALSMLSLLGFVLLTTTRSLERRRRLLTLLRHLGANPADAYTTFAVLEAIPLGVAAFIGAFAALGYLVNAYFGQIAVQVALPAAAVASLGIGLAAFAIEGAAGARLAARTR